ncbi:GTP cyclohydrolase 1 type 2/Nif3 [Melampsora americana]|nr:GTP cyclohydrolase 1 type 2/Nif3 [Melampsora americana]
MSQLLKSVQRAFNKIAPPSLAERWDNTGLLIESPVPKTSATNVLLTIDLTPSVANEALSKHSNIGVIVTYHPILFRPLKSLTTVDPLQEIMLKCIASGISIYSPHTSLDSVIGGVNDHLCSIVAGDQSDHPSQIFTVNNELINGPSLSGIGVGGGRRICFEANQQVSLMEIVNRCKTGLNLSHVQLAQSRVGQSLIRSVGVCAGSGASICEALGTSCDVFLTGEMSHHEVLSANARGVHIILTSHSNTERFFLGKVLKERLKELLLEDQAKLLEDERGDQWDVIVSSEDRDPLVIV